MTDAADKEAFERVYLGGNQLLARRNSTDGNYVLPSINDAWCGFHSALEYVRQVPPASVAVDAERYRWLREYTTLRNRGFGPLGCYLEIADGLEWDEALWGKFSDHGIIDRAIDAKIAELKQGK